MLLDILHFIIKSTTIFISQITIGDILMGRPAKPIEVKSCLNCGGEHTRQRSNYCSNKCGYKSQWDDKRKRHQSNEIKKWKQTDEGEDNSFTILKNKKIPPTIPDPNAPHLNRNQFRADGCIWTVVDGSDPEDGRFIVGEDPIEDVPDWENLKFYIQNF